jgi:hypothetical protein
MLTLAACGRVGFDAAADRPPADGAVGGEVALRCGDTRAIATLGAAPLGLALVVSASGAVVMWSAAAATSQLSGVRLGIADDAITSTTTLSTSLPQPVTRFSLAADGDARAMVVAAVTGGALILPLDGALQPGLTWSIQPSTGALAHAIAPPVVPGAEFVIAWVAGSQVRFSQVDAGGAPVGTLHVAPAGRDPAVRRAAQRQIVAWTAGGTAGCAVWAFDAGFAAVRVDPLVHAPGGTCVAPVITRHDVGTNLLAWIDGGAAHAQLGTDTAIVGDELAIGAGGDAVEVSLAPSGFFVAVTAGGSILPGYVRSDATGWTPLPAVPHAPGSPIQLVEDGRGALLASIAGPPAEPQVWITRLCEPR